MRLAKGLERTDPDFEAGMARLRRAKLERVAPLLREDLEVRHARGKPDFLSPELRRSTRVSRTSNVSSNRYDKPALALIEQCREGLVLDCGAGRRDAYFANVVNLEIADYDTTDVLGVGEELPFKDASFDAVLSIAVLEHVRNPFRCADEIVRVLKPGGRLICCVPFLQPYHGYPHHYFNMTGQGLRALFEDALQIEDHQVTGSMGPIWSLGWIIDSWAAGLPPDVRERFLDQRLKELTGPPRDYLERDFVKALPQAKVFELASATLLFASKPPLDGGLPGAHRGPDHYGKGARARWPGWLRRLLRRPRQA
jgi:SAM-dependent methyltransferase